MKNQEWATYIVVFALGLFLGMWIKDERRSHPPQLVCMAYIGTDCLRWEFEK